MNLIGLAFVLAFGMFVESFTGEAPQAGRTYRVGFLGQGSADATEPALRAFIDALKGLGYVEGREYSLEARHADGRTELLPGLAAELVALPVDVIVTPHMVAAAEEALALVTGDKRLAEAILRERLDPRENPEFTAEAKSEMLKAPAPALVNILSAELEAYGRDPEK